MRPILGLLIIIIAITLLITQLSTRVWKVVLLTLLALFIVAAVNAQQPEGFVLRGDLTSAASDGSGYFKIGEALILMTPKDSALLPGLRALEGKRVVVTVLEDR